MADKLHCYMAKLLNCCQTGGQAVKLFNHLSISFSSFFQLPTSHCFIYHFHIYRILPAGSSGNIIILLSYFPPGAAYHQIQQKTRYTEQQSSPHRAPEAWNIETAHKLRCGPEEKSVYEQRKYSQWQDIDGQGYDKNYRFQECIEQSEYQGGRDEHCPVFYTDSGSQINYNEHYYQCSKEAEDHI